MIPKLKILITGAGGIIGTEMCRRFLKEATTIALDVNGKSEDLEEDIVWEQADIANFNAVEEMCNRHVPDVVIHCAGIAHQKVGAVSTEDYMRINSEATENLAKVAALLNPHVRFIFLSTVSVYGEKNLTQPVSEDSDCNPSSDYAVSKCDAERRLIALSEGGALDDLIILRLAPVYDRCWRLNLDRRVFALRKITYIRFGSGLQKMSALARPNLIDFVHYIVQDMDTHSLNTCSTRNDKKQKLQIFNVCDATPYEFRTIIRTFKKTGFYPTRPVIFFPLPAVWLACRIAGIVFRNKREWIHSCYDKLAADLIYNNEKMLVTGFTPFYNLENVF